MGCERGKDIDRLMKDMYFGNGEEPFIVVIQEMRDDISYIKKHIEKKSWSISNVLSLIMAIIALLTVFITVII